MFRRLESWFRTLGARLLGPGEILGYDPDDGLEPDGGNVTQLAACQHRRWSSCTWRTYGGTWGWFQRCLICGAYARC